MRKTHPGEGDGDLHFNVTPDPKFQYLLNNGNNGEMVVEIICWDKPNPSYTQQFGSYCNGVETRQHFPTLPTIKEGDYVRVTGKWVQDIGYPTPTHSQ